MLLIRELRAAHIPILAAPEIPGRGPIIPPFEQRYILVPPGLPGGWALLLRLRSPPGALGMVPTL